MSWHFFVYMKPPALPNLLNFKTSYREAKPFYVFNLYRFKVDVEQYPTIKRLNQTLLEIEAFKVTNPSCQPDTPADLRA